MKISFAVAALLGLTRAAPADDFVESLPQMGDSFDFGVYSGYIPLTGPSKKIHYLFLESQGNPQADPLVIWYNGGPGCSSMLAFLQENGPYKFEDGETTAVKSDYSWNREANVLYIEHPAGVGFSYCNSDNGDNCAFTDDNQASDNLETVLGWYDMFPEYKNHDLYISGESYAGIYVPYLMNQIHTYNQGSPSFQIPLKGMMVGNGVTNWRYDTIPAFIEMSFWHSLLDTETYDKMKVLGCDYSGLEFDEEPSEECMGLVNHFADAVDGVNGYDIFGKCWSDSAEGGNHLSMPGQLGLMAVSGKLKAYNKGTAHSDYTPWMKKLDIARSRNATKGPKKNVKDDDAPPCIFASGVTDYLNSAEVRSALHIPDDVQAWTMCKGDIDYTTYQAGSQWVWESLKGEYRMLKYSGDIDGSVPTTGTLGWINSLGRTINKEQRPFYWMDGETKNLGGYITEWDGLTLASFEMPLSSRPRTRGSLEASKARNQHD